MSLWEFACCMEGMVEFHGGKKAPGASSWTDEEAREMGIVGFE